ncbi:tRNA guanosine(34) transglycosylase Tgt, partial [Candidatus Woesearchaeota archaeon]|nr:tRNA guanosine(34) transglycosylase Tgt [Candidatus Woesearchaeota archaeon]
SIHNLHFMKQLVDEAKKAIKEKRFFQFKEDFHNIYKLNIFIA